MPARWEVMSPSDAPLEIALSAARNPEIEDEEDDDDDEVILVSVAS